MSSLNQKTLIKPPLKILNLYAGIGGNRKLWGDENEVTAVEFDENIAAVYKNFYQNDTVVVGDAMAYLLEHYEEYDIIWVSPPCPSHSRARYPRVGVKYSNGKKYGAIYPDMSLYQIIILLQYHFKGKYIVENVIPYYTYLIEPSVILHRHAFWTNFNVMPVKFEDDSGLYLLEIAANAIIGVNGRASKSYTPCLF